MTKKAVLGVSFAILIVLVISALLKIMYNLSSFRKSLNTEQYMFGEEIKNYLSPATNINFNEQRCRTIIVEAEDELKAISSLPDSIIPVVQKRKMREDFETMKIDINEKMWDASHWAKYYNRINQSRINQSISGKSFDLTRLMPGDIILVYVQHGQQLNGINRNGSGNHPYMGGKMSTFRSWLSRLVVDDFTLPHHVTVVVKSGRTTDEILLAQSGANPSLMSLPNMSMPFDDYGVITQPLSEMMRDCTMTAPYARIVIARLNINVMLEREMNELSKRKKEELNLNNNENDLQSSTNSSSSFCRGSTTINAPRVAKQIAESIGDAVKIISGAGAIYSSNYLLSTVLRKQSDHSSLITIDNRTGEIISKQHGTTTNPSYSGRRSRNNNNRSNVRNVELLIPENDINGTIHPAFRNLLQLHRHTFSAPVWIYLQKKFNTQNISKRNIFNIASLYMMEENDEEEDKCDAAFKSAQSIPLSLVSYNGNEQSQSLWSSIYSTEKFVKKYSPMIKSLTKMTSPSSSKTYSDNVIRDNLHSLNLLDTSLALKSSWSGVLNREFICSSMTYAILEYAGLVVPCSYHPFLVNDPVTGCRVSVTFVDKSTSFAAVSTGESSPATPAASPPPSKEGLRGNSASTSSISPQINDEFRNIRYLNPTWIQPHDFLRNDFQWMPAIAIASVIPVYEY